MEYNKKQFSIVKSFYPSVKMFIEICLLLNTIKILHNIYFLSKKSCIIFFDYAAIVKYHLYK